MNKEEYNNDFYEDAGDLLADFRKQGGGGILDKDGKDPFSKDPDILQSGRDDKLIEDERSGSFYRNKE